MGDYISREAALTVLDWDCASQDALDAIKTIPADDVRPVVRGKWEMNSNYPDRLICSECGAQFDCWHWEAKQMHFCPSCGAKMDGKSADYAQAKPYDLLYEEGGPDA